MNIGPVCHMRHNKTIRCCSLHDTDEEEDLNSTLEGGTRTTPEQRTSNLTGSSSATEEWQRSTLVGDEQVTTVQDLTDDDDDVTHQAWSELQQLNSTSRGSGKRHRSSEVPASQHVETSTCVTATNVARVKHTRRQEDRRGNMDLANGSMTVVNSSYTSTSRNTIDSCINSAIDAVKCWNACLPPIL